MITNLLVFISTSLVTNVSEVFIKPDCQACNGFVYAVYCDPPCPIKHSNHTPTAKFVTTTISERTIYKFNYLFEDTEKDEIISSKTEKFIFHANPVWVKDTNYVDRPVFIKSYYMTNMPMYPKFQ